MSMRLDDDRLEAVLQSIGVHLDTGVATDSEETAPPTKPDAISSLPARRARRRPTRWLAVAAAVLVVAVLVGILTPAGETVARWFGIGKLTITFVPPDDTTPPPTETIFSDSVTALDSATAYADAELDPATFDASVLGRPDRFGRPPEQGVLFGWTPSDTTLWVRDGADPFVGKKVVERTGVSEVPGLGDYALFIDGAHVLETPSRRLRADRVLWWIADDHEYRLESPLPQGEMIRIARLVD